MNRFVFYRLRGNESWPYTSVFILILFILPLTLSGENKFSNEEELASALISTQPAEERAQILSAHGDLVNPKLWKALWNFGDQQRQLGNYTQALKIFQLSLDVSKKIKDKKGEADSFWGIGVIQRFQGDYPIARKSFENSLSIYESLDDKIGIATIWHNIGVVHFKQGEYDLAMEFYKKSLALKEQIGYTAGMPTSMSVIGDFYYWQGNYAVAMEYWQKSLSLRQSIGDKKGIPAALNDIAAIYYSQGNYPLAIETYKQVFKLYEEAGNQIGVGVGLHNLGETLYREGNYGEALEYLKKCLTLREKLGEKADISSTLQTIGDVYVEMGKLDLALQYLQKSLSMTVESGEKPSNALVLYDIARVFNQQGKQELALDFAGRAADIAAPISNLETLWNAQNIKGKAHLALHQTASAQQAFESALATIEILRNQSAGGEQEQQVFFETKISPYHSMASLLIDEGKVEEALAYSERAKARVLTDVLHGGRRNVEKAMTESERQKESALKKQLVSLSVELQRMKNSDPRLEKFTTNLGKARMDYEAFRMSLYAQHPKLQVQRGELSPATISEAAELIEDQKTALLEYLVTEQRAYLFVLTKGSSGNQLKAYPIPISQKELSSKVDSFRTRLAERDPRFAASARDLYQKLLAPALTQLEGKKTWIIIPDHILWELPFQCLQTSKRRFLIEDLTISYAPSFTVLREMSRLKRKEEGVTKELFALGNPEIGKEAREQSQEVLRGKTLEPLPAAEKEVEALVKVYGPEQSKVYIGKDASEVRMKNDASTFRILHFATHGIFDNASPMYSNIVLARSANAEEDGLLEAWEILGMDLHAWLAVLSACETARGRIGDGEGMIGLTWAFFVAGVPTTLVSQWKVESGSTAELMLEFHKNLKEAGMSSAEALQNAELKLLRSDRYRHPFYWASFVIIGDGSHRRY